MRNHRFSIGLKAGLTALTVTLLVTGTLCSTAAAGGAFGSNQNGPAVRLSPRRINFGDVTLGKSASRELTVTNTGNATLNIMSISIESNNGSVDEGTSCGSSLAPGASCTVSLTWFPDHPGKMTGNITFTDNAPNSPQTVPLKGFAVSENDR